MWRLGCCSCWSARCWWLPVVWGTGSLASLHLLHCLEGFQSAPFAWQLSWLPEEGWFWRGCNQIFCLAITSTSASALQRHAAPLLLSLKPEISQGTLEAVQAEMQVEAEAGVA